MTDDRPDSHPRPDLSEVPPALLAHDTGLSPERLRELFAAEDAYTRPPSRSGGDDT